MRRMYVVTLLTVFISSSFSIATLADPPTDWCVASSWDGEDSCSSKGACDNYLTRDDYNTFSITHPMVIRLRFVVFADGNDDLLASAQDVIDQVDILNQAYEDYGIQFSAPASPTTVYESEYWNFYVTGTCYLNEEGPDMCRVSCIDPPGDTHDEWDMKAAHGDDPDEQINIYVVNFQNGNYSGLQYYPWCALATGVMGGVIVDYRSFGKKCDPGGTADCHTMTHEIGHNLGLWHTFQGVDPYWYPCRDCSEQSFCDGSEPYDRDCDSVGDFCSDTPAAEVNYTCNSTEGVDCEDTPLPAPDGNNYMSYGPHGCIDHFSPQQVRRMHCWTCDRLKGWIDSPDCNSNDTPDVCDITSGTSNDCDENGIPDECQTDCNENDVPDSCDIESATSDDCDENGVPDECELLGSCCIPSVTCFECMRESPCDQLNGNWGAMGNCIMCAMAP